MNVATITMDKDLAREKLRAYRAATHKDAEEQYRQCAAGYEALARGTPLLNLDDVFRAVPLDEKCRPKLAIARADRPQVRFQWAGSRTEATFWTNWRNSYRHGESYVRTVDMGRRHGLKYGSQNQWDATVDGYALVPLVPADVRPRFGQLKDRFILWEVDKWSDMELGLKAPVDPMLLQHVGGSLYAVLAQWDLTDLERAILEGSMMNRT